MATAQLIAKAVKTLSVAGFPFPAGSDSRAVAKVWAAVFADIEDDELGAAVRAFLTAETYSVWPTPGRIMQHVPSVRQAKELEAADDADEMFGRLRSLLWVYHPHDGRTPATEQLHPYAPKARAMQHAIAAFGGWRGFHASLNDNEAACRKAFRDAYRGAVARTKATEPWAPRLAAANPEPRRFAAQVASAEAPSNTALPRNLGAELGQALARRPT